TTPPGSNESLLGGESASGAPEAYADWNVPEGFELDADVGKEINTLFKASNLSQEAGQKLIDFYTEKTKEAFEAPFEAYKEMRERWRTETKADPEIGAKLDQVKITVHRALDSLGDPKLKSDFVKAMDETGMGDNPTFIKVLNRLATKLTEGTFVAGNGPSPHGQIRSGVAARPSLAQAIYGADGPKTGLAARE
ncbi:MAG: hypothetical protein HRJ53_30285, partial [Acidobacteria bacterium Pan2503]|nr:hypothetical protein [Candidatus Acidoferrum panamensis]